MSQTTYQWAVALHSFGFVLWTAGMFACLRVLGAQAAAGAGAPEALSRSARGTAVFMDIGATIAIGSGLYLALAMVPSPFQGAGWLHAKLTIVLLGLVGLHGFLRVKVRKLRNGDVRPLPGLAMPLLIALVLGVIVLVQVKPF